MRAYIASFMISMNSHVQTHQLLEAFVFVAHHVSKVAAPVKQTIWLNMLVVFILPAVYVCSYAW